jgi:hypothetical protein
MNMEEEEKIHPLQKFMDNIWLLLAYWGWPYPFSHIHYGASLNC